MPLANCPECGHLFNRLHDRLCPACTARENEQFDRVRAHMRENNVHSATQLADETEVPRDVILRWVDEGRLELQRTDEEREGCKRCGKPAEHGDLCNRCKTELAQQIAAQRGAASAPPRPAAVRGQDLTQRMHTRPS